VSFTAKWRHFDSDKGYPSWNLPSGLYNFSGNDRESINAQDALNFGHQAVNEKWRLIICNLQ